MQRGGGTKSRLARPRRWVPAYMTTMRPQTAPMTPRSWLMSSRGQPQPLHQISDQFQHLALDGDIQGGRGFVGDKQAGCASEGLGQ